MVATDTIRRQAGVIAYRIIGGELRVSLVTSRDSGRWVIPKGNIEPGSPSAQTAVREAYEEAGVEGTIVGEAPLGVYSYLKKQGSGRDRRATVEVYFFRVERQLKKWPEKHARRARWVSVTDAVRLVEEPGLAELLIGPLASGEESKRIKSGLAIPSIRPLSNGVFPDDLEQALQPADGELRFSV
jgi:8-oxo-dGTP pyrophosphatase MutT (NUDIX family)